MTADWTDFLTQAGAVFDDDRVLNFGDPVAESRAALEGEVLCDLSHLRLIRIQGEDAQGFLQGQFTNDVRRITPERSQLGAWCSPKGRMMVNFRLFIRDDGYYLRLPGELLAPTLKRLRLFVLRSRVKLEEAHVLIHFGLSGPRAAKRLQESLGGIPTQADGVFHDQSHTVIRLPGATPRFEIYAPVQATKTLWLNLASHARPAGAEVWRLLDIRAGLPTVYPATTEVFVPQMTNLHLLDAVSFKKGCYSGQEVVARTQYLGKLKRRMFRARVAGPTLPRPGDELHSPLAGESQGAGRVVDAAPHPDGGFELLAVALIDCAGRDALYLGRDGPKLELEALPYVFETPEG